MRLPRAAEAHIDPLKLSGYLLDPEHPRGGPKARFLLAGGFRRDAPDALRRALLEHARSCDVARRTVDGFGVKFVLRGPLRTPDGREPDFKTVWRLQADGTPYLVTAYPA